MSSALQGLQATKQIRTALEKATAESKALPKQVADAETKLASAKGALEQLGDKFKTTPPETLKDEVGKALDAARSAEKKDKPLLAALYTLKDKLDSVAPAELEKALGDDVKKLGESIPALKEKQAAAEKAVKDLTAEYKDYQNVLPDKGQIESWEKDRSAVAARQVEADLAGMRDALKKFDNLKVPVVSPCARKKLEEFTKALEKEVDKVAHKAKCHRCAATEPLKGIDRTDEAKKLIDDKIKRLDELSKLPDDSTVKAEEKPDYVLAKALAQLRDVPNENGETAGKMIGVLICKDSQNRDVYLYGYSGEIATEYLAAHKEVELLKRKLKASEDAKDAIPELSRLADAAGSALLDAQSKLQVAEEKVRKEEETAKEESAALKSEAEPVVDIGKSGKKGKPPSEAVQEVGRLKQDVRKLQGQKDSADRKLKVSQDALLASHQVEETKLALVAAQQREAKAAEKDTPLELAAQQKWAPPIPQTGEKAIIKSVGGDSVPLASLNTAEHIGAKNTPHGVCAAPKMVQDAIAKGLKPVAMAEAWFGGGTNSHGELVASCDTCMKNVGFQFCPKPSHV